jgi:hypothetical protein
MPVKEGDKVKAQSRPEIWVIQGGERHWIPDAATLQSRFGGWQNITILSDAEVDQIVVGTIVQSVIRSGVNDGDLVATPGTPGIYLVEGGRRRAVPDPVTFVNLGYDWNLVQQMPLSELHAIPLGASLPAAHTLRQSGESDLGWGHFMYTAAALNIDSGHVVANTRTRATWMFAGFVGAVFVVASNWRDEFLGATGTHTFGVDGTWVGEHDRADAWSDDIDPAIAGAAEKVVIVHTWKAEYHWKQIIQDAIDSGKSIASFAGQIAPFAALL